MTRKQNSSDHIFMATKCKINFVVYITGMTHSNNGAENIKQNFLILV